MRLTVADASVAVSWVLSDEDQEVSAASGRLLLASQRGEIGLLVPVLWYYEVLNALRTAVARGRIPRQQGEEAFGTLLELNVGVASFPKNVQRTWGLALDNGISAYDAAYLALAEDNGCECYSADRRLVQRAAGTGFVRWIGDFE